ncbi:hypothetical protein [Moraxella lacunata]|uniref:hypothetical protein n=1 Tax=Moraxella lacunata TaxID=477 RepID=UPI003EDFF05E
MVAPCSPCAVAGVLAVLGSALSVATSSLWLGIRAYSVSINRPINTTANTTSRHETVIIDKPNFFMAIP